MRPCGCFLMARTFAVCDPFSAEAAARAAMSIAVNQNLSMMTVGCAEERLDTRETVCPFFCLEPGKFPLAYEARRLWAYFDTFARASENMRAWSAPRVNGASRPGVLHRQKRGRRWVCLITILLI